MERNYDMTQGMFTLLRANGPFMLYERRIVVAAAQAAPWWPAPKAAAV